MKRNIVIFDLGNVLVRYDWETFLSSFQFDETTYQAVANAIFLSDVWQQGDAVSYTHLKWKYRCYPHNNVSERTERGTDKSRKENISK